MIRGFANAYWVNCSMLEPFLPSFGEFIYKFTLLAHRCSASVGARLEWNNDDNVDATPSLGS